MAENGLQDDFIECPLCMEPLAFDDINFYPCACRYQICRFCWHRIRTDENGLCPHCREPYSENPAEYTPPTQEQMAKLKSAKKQKNVEKRQKIIESRKNLASVRVVQKNLVFVIGLSPRLADPEVLKKNEYFGKFGRIYKVVINNHTVYNGAQGPSVSAYVTYVKNEDASKAITAVNNAYIDGRYLKASFGTTKYCTSFLRGMPCSKPDCMYLHELGDDDASFTKEDMQLGKHQVYETATLAAANIPASFKDMQQQQQHAVVMGTSGGGVKIKHVAHNKPAVASDSAESALPATASWGSSVKSSTNASGSETIAQVPAKDTKTNVNPPLAHSHSIGATTRHKHQQLHKSHSHSPSHSTGASHTSSSSSHSRSGSSKLASKELSASHHSRTKSGPLSPTHNNELSTSTSSKKQQLSSNSGHNRSNSSSKSTPSLSPKSTLSGSSSSGSLKHDVENEIATSEAKSDRVLEGGESEEPSLNSSREEGESDVIGDDGGEGEDTERGLVVGGGGGWCQIEETTEARCTTAVDQSGLLEQNEVRETEQMMSEVVIGAQVKEGEKEREGRENLSAVGERPLSEEPKPTPNSSSQQRVQKEGEAEDSSIVKVIPSFGGGAGQFGSLGVSWNTALPQHLSSSSSSAAEPSHNQTTTISEDVTTPTHHEDDLGFDPWDVSQQGLADLMKSEQHQSHQHSSTTTTHSIGGMPLSNGIGNGNKSSLLQEEFRALFPSANVSFEGPGFGAVGGSSDILLSSSASSSKPVGAIPTASPATSTSSYVPSRLDSALSSTYHPLLGTSPIPPITSSSSSMSTSGGGGGSGSLSMFLGQHQPGFPSSSIKVHSRSSPASFQQQQQTQSVGSKLASSEWPDLGVSITSKSSTPSQWLPATTDTASTDSTTTKDSSVSGSTATSTSTSSSTSSTLPPPPPGFTAKTTPTPGSTFPVTATVSSSSSSSATSASARAPGTTLNNTVNHSMWTGSVGNVKGNITSNHLLQSWANFINFSSLSPAQQQQLVRGSQFYQQLLIQQQYLIRQSLLIQSSPYYQAHAQALAQAQATLRAQMQQNILRQQQVVTAIRAIAGQKVANSAPGSSAAVSTSVSGGGSNAVGAHVASSSTSGGNGVPPVCHSGATGLQQTHTQQHSSSSAKAFTTSEATAAAVGAVKTAKHGLSSEHQQRHIQHQQQQAASLSKQQQSRTVSSSKPSAIVTASKNSATNGAHSNTATTGGGGGQGSSDRKTVRLKAK